LIPSADILAPTRAVQADNILNGLECVIFQPMLPWSGKQSPQSAALIGVVYHHEYLACRVVAGQLWDEFVVRLLEVRIQNQ